MNLTHDDVQEILRIIDSSPYDEVRVDTGDFKLTLRREGGGWTEERHTERSEEAAPVRTETVAAAPEALEPGIAAIYPPLVGTFYRAPKPGADPFIEVGSVVEEDTVVAIIETMKLMNSVRAGVSGTVVEICAENAEFVEEGRILIKLRTDTP